MQAQRFAMQIQADDGEILPLESDLAAFHGLHLIVAAAQQGANPEQGKQRKHQAAAQPFGGLGREHAVMVAARP
ncbi:hypothetical protein GCM10010872_36330 [Dyella flava]|nr:hypothetical protein GCM10010872_36330 [Dyella flava]